MICWYGTAKTGWEWPLRIISTVLLWGLVISGTAALVRYLRGAQRPTAPSAQAPAAEGLGVERLAGSELDEPGYQRRGVVGVLDAAMRPAARPVSDTVLATAA